MPGAKPYAISKQAVWQAYCRVKANRGAAGVDGQSLAAFEKDLKGNLYKIWNRMSSGCYFPPPVRLVEIEKDGGKTRPLGIPTVADRVAQMVVKIYLEPQVEPHFHVDSYGYRPGKSALDAVATARQRCWRSHWAIDLDIKGFFDHLDHDLVMKAVRHHTDLPWVRLYVERWLKAPVQQSDGVQEMREQGSPQGSVISPLLANLFMHYAFDAWMQRHYPHVQFERYADDVLIHAKSRAQAEHVLRAVRERLGQCHLQLHPEKTRIVYCQGSGRRAPGEHISFDFLGFTFRPRRAKDRQGRSFTSFQPAISAKAAKAIHQTVRGWRLARIRNNQSLMDIARLINPVVRGWVRYYGRFYRSQLIRVLYCLHNALIRWACRKYKRLRNRPTAAVRWLGRVASRDPDLLALWQVGLKPSAGIRGAG
ncbi:MAG: group II intron reverse transcriptase/maturase [Bacteroidetes bacterium]|nr:group II intron reverse transcriptase/maturase [Bacteroidota bacterium]